jgi:TetR/AcrR family transcriptional repressor of nem operon
VGIRKASIHHHFPSKVDLVRTLVRQYRESAEIGLTELAVAVPDSLELLQSFAGNWARCIDDASIPFCVCALLASELPALPPEVASEVGDYFLYLSSWLTGVMQRGAEQGTLTIDAPAPVEAEMFMASVHGAMLSARAQNNAALFDTILKPTLRRLSPKAH